MQELNVFSGMTGKRLSPIAILQIHKNKDVDYW